MSIEITKQNQKMFDRILYIQKGNLSSLPKRPTSKNHKAEFNYPGASASTLRKKEGHKIDAENDRLQKAIVAQKPMVDLA